MKLVCTGAVGIFLFKGAGSIENDFGEVVFV
jgi:hypothetical protein